MGLKDRILDFVARWGSPTMDHPSRGGMTGDPADDEPDEENNENGGTDADATEEEA